MKLTKEYLIKVIKEEINKTVKESAGDWTRAMMTGDARDAYGVQKTKLGKSDAPDDKAAKRAGSASVKMADEVVKGMLSKASNLNARLEQLKGTQTRKLALARSLLVNVADIDPAMIDKMISQLQMATKKK